MQNKEGIKGRHWFLESDLKDGITLKLDKTSKSILTVLRHLGRLQEVSGQQWEPWQRQYWWGTCTVK